MATPLRASVSAEQLAHFPLSQAALASRTNIADVADVSFVHSTSSLGPLCCDLYGDLPLGMYCAKDLTLRSAWGFIFTGDGALLAEQNGGVLSPEDFLQKLEAALPQTRLKRPVEQLLSLVSTCTDCFWHWMMDSLPKVFIAEALGYRGHYLVPADAVAPWGRRSLSLVGIDAERLISSDESDLLVSSLYVPTYFSGFNAHWNARFMRGYRGWILSYVAAPSASASQRLFVVRPPSAKTRRIINRCEVESLVKSFGFAVVCFEELLLEEQIQVAASARVMLAAHGSGLTHSLFMPEQSSLVEIFPFERVVSCDCYETLAQVIDHQYVSIDTQLDRGVDIEVDVATLQSVLVDVLG